jgi:hypothetical protein
MSGFNTFLTYMTAYTLPFEEAIDMLRASNEVAEADSSNPVKCLMETTWSLDLVPDLVWDKVGLLRDLVLLVERTNCFTKVLTDPSKLHDFKAEDIKPWLRIWGIVNSLSLEILKDLKFYIAKTEIHLTSPNGTNGSWTYDLFFKSLKVLSSPIESVPKILEREFVISENLKSSDKIQSIFYLFDLPKELSSNTLSAALDLKALLDLYSQSLFVCGAESAIYRWDANILSSNNTLSLPFYWPLINYLSNKVLVSLQKAPAQRTPLPLPDVGAISLPFLKVLMSQGLEPIYKGHLNIPCEY